MHKLLEFPDLKSQLIFTSTTTSNLSSLARLALDSINSESEINFNVENGVSSKYIAELYEFRKKTI